jgi:predicted dehydrogenase
MTLVAGCDTNPALASVLPQGVRYHTQLEDALERDDIDVVVVATPNQTHNRIALSALDAGFHVIIEKPAAGNEEELEALHAATERSGRLLWFAFHAATASEVLWTEQHLKQEIQNYGELTAFHSHFMDPYVDPMNRKTPSAESLQTPWRDSGINAISVLERLMPKLELEATELQSSRQVGEKGCILRETAHFQFGSAGYGCVDTAWDQQINLKTTDLYFGHSGTRLSINHSAQSVMRQTSSGDKQELAVFAGDRLTNHYLNLFAEAAMGINQGRSNTASGDKAHRIYFSALDEGTRR